MAIFDDAWFEIWYSEGAGFIPYYLLVVTFDKPNGDVLVLDPFQKNEITFRAKQYEVVKDWLRADDYELVEGRMFPDVSSGERLELT
jgi:hypothetical protein